MTRPVLELVTTEADDGEPLDGALFWPASSSVPHSGIVLFHGGGAEFYVPILRRLGEDLAARGWPVLTLNRRDHGSNFGFVTIERGAMDQRAGVDFLQSRGVEQVVMGGHSYATLTVPWYVARTDDPRVVGLLLYSALGDMHRAAVALCGGAESYDGYVSRSRQAVAEARGAEEFVMPALVNGAHSVLTSHEVFLDKRGPESDGDPIALLGQVGDRPVLAFRHVRDPFPGVSSQDEASLRAATRGMTLILLGEPGPQTREAHYLAGEEVNVVEHTTAWLTENGFTP